MMTRWSGLYLVLSFVSLCMKVHSGIYIPKRLYKFYIPSDARSDDVIGVINVIQNPYLDCTPSGMETTLAREVFSQLDESKIFIRVMSNMSSITFTETSFNLTIKCPMDSPIAAYYEPLFSTTVHLHSESFVDAISTTTGGHSLNSVSGRNNVQTACPRNEDLVYQIIENSPTGAIDVFNIQRLSIVVLESEGNYLLLNSSTGELHLTKSPDRETLANITQTLHCKLGISDDADARIVTLVVYDVDDNPPYTKLMGTSQMSSVSNVHNMIELRTYDNDSLMTTTNKTYRVYTEFNTSHLVMVNSSEFRGIRRTILIKTSVVLEILSEPYTVEVIVEDLFYKPDLQATNASNKAVYTILVPANHSLLAPPRKIPPIPLYVDVAAAKFSLVVALAGRNNRTSTGSTQFKITGLVPPNAREVLAVTSDGDVYVNDSRKLSRYNEPMPITATVMRSDGGDNTTEKYNLVINVSNNTGLSLQGVKCDSGCPIHNTSESCTASCGLGSPTGRCTWRSSPGVPSLSHKYSTCSPSLNTCPDGVCSLLESLHFLICPQDCTTGPVTGEAFTNKHRPGINMAKGTCWCENALSDGKLFCNCQPPKISQKRSRISLPSSHQGNAQTYVRHHGDTVVCSLICKVIIAGSLVGVVVVIMGLVLACLVCRRRRLRQAGTLKHVGSLVSMNAVPSDYIVDDSLESRGHANRQASSPASSHWPGKNGISHNMIDDKWEFPRQYLTLEHVIGEGEFGQVIRAQAFMLRGQEGNTVVAIKMLKPDASGSEYQDLVSEIQLLKEVNHPNVIQLLGVCTQKGPLFAIVEYCELGSLRNFLRCSKFKNKGSWENRTKRGNDVDGLASDGLVEPRNLSCRDLFSFAWQIAKGMDYLASLKIVHRDLAARNVLVTDGMKMKISDFGLSRDVYEADTYLKMSKGRIPVKWMAPESLYAQVYTTKSDIWSYGVVLWEIVTLGASPYPGIPPERLFPLLSTGYRMDRPDDCPEELYAIMQKCWKTEPENRPSFCALKDILDNLLQQNTEYLELSSANNCLYNGTHASSDDKPCDNQSTIHADIKPQYSNVCSVSHCQPNVYVATHNDVYDEETEECPEMSKLLGNSDSLDPWMGTAKPSDIILDKAMMDGRKGTNRLLVHENLTYV